MKKRPLLIAYIIVGVGLLISFGAVGYAIDQVSKQTEEIRTNNVAGCERSNDLRELLQNTNNALATLVATSLRNAPSLQKLTPDQEDARGVFKEQLVELNKAIPLTQCEDEYNGEDNGE